MFGRMMERTGMSVFLMLCTLNFINIETDDENQKYYSELLRESIQKAVRKGDFYTRYNIQQYLVMLSLLLNSLLIRFDTSVQFSWVIPISITRYCWMLYRV